MPRKRKRAGPKPGRESPRTRAEKNRQRIEKLVTRLTDYRRAYLKITTGKVPTRDEVQRSPEFRNIINALNVKSNNPSGRKARALEQLGLRSPSWTFAVGETPPGSHLPPMLGRVPKRLHHRKR